MTCAQLTGFLVEYIEGTLPREVRQEFEAHLALCLDCVNYLQQYRDTIRLVAGAGDETGLHDLPDDLVAAVTSALRDGRRALPALTVRCRTPSARRQRSRSSR